MQIKIDNKSEQSKKEIYHMYDEIFGDPKPFTDYYFEEIYPNNTVYQLYDHDKMAAMLHLNPYKIQCYDDLFEISYIVAVATRKEQRRKGCMARLLCEAMEEEKRKGKPFVYLIPAKKEYYLPFGFRFAMDWYQTVLPALKNEKKEVCGMELIKYQKEKEEEVIAWINACRKENDIYVKADKQYVRRIQKEMQSEQGDLLLLYKENKLQMVCAYGKEEDTIYISQIHCKNEEAQAVEALRNYFSDYNLHMTAGHGQQRENWEKKPKIMVRILDPVYFMTKMRAVCSQKLCIQITDAQINDNNKTYEWDVNRNESTVKETNKTPDLTCTIEEFSELIWNETLSGIKKDSQFFHNLIKKNRVFLMEEV